MLTLSVFAPMQAQRQALKNMPYIDQRRFHYGFLLGMDFCDVTFMHSGVNGWRAEGTAVNPCFCVGLMGDAALTENLNVRTTPMLRFESREITYRNDSTGQMLGQSLKSNYLSLPLSLKVATHRLNNYRPYMLLGGQIDFDVTHENDQPLAFKHVDVGLHVAIGCDGYLPYFKFCPELRFNLGLLDMVDRKRKDLKDQPLPPQTQALSRARNKSISLLFFFE